MATNQFWRVLPPHQGPPRPPPRTFNKTAPRNFYENPAAHQPNRPETPEWQESSMRLVRSAGMANSQSGDLRETSAFSKLATLRTVERNASRVDSALQKKVEQTADLKNHLDSTLSNLQREMHLLTRVKDQLSQTLSDREAPLQTMQKRVGVRTYRPVREGLYDAVEKALMDERDDLVTTCDRLESAITQSGTHLQAMRDIQRQVQEDVRDKSHGMQLDERCIGTSFVPDKIGSMPRLANATGSPRFVGAREGVERIASSPKHPQDWRLDTHQLIARAEDHSDHARTLQGQFSELIRDVTQCNTAHNEHTARAFQTKLMKTNALQARLQEELHNVMAEIGTATSERASAMRALAEKERPWNILQQRLHLRQLKPHREKVRDEVEEAMVAELADLGEVVDELHRTVQRLDGQLAALAATQRELEEDLRDKRAAHQLDKQCLTLTGVCAPPAPQTVRTYRNY